MSGRRRFASPTPLLGRLLRRHVGGARATRKCCSRRGFPSCAAGPDPAGLGGRKWRRCCSSSCRALPLRSAGPRPPRAAAPAPGPGRSQRRAGLRALYIHEVTGGAGRREGRAPPSPGASGGPAAAGGGGAGRRGEPLRGPVRPCRSGWRSAGRAGGPSGGGGRGLRCGSGRAPRGSRARAGREGRGSPPEGPRRLPKSSVFPAELSFDLPCSLLFAPAELAALCSRRYRLRG